MNTRKIATSQKNRKCIVPGCKRLLSIYNHTRYCHADLNKRSRRESWRAEATEPAR